MAIQTQINALLSDQVFAIYNNAESIMLDKVAKRVNKGITTPGWNEKKLQDMQAMRRELEAVTNDLTKLINTKLSKGLKDAYKTGTHSASDDLRLPRTILSDTHTPAKLQRLILESNNLVGSSSFKILRNTDDAYRRLQAEVTVGTLTGVDTRRQIASRFLNRLADQGITSFTDKRGRNWEMGAYAEMVTRTTTSQASLAGHIDRQLEAGRDLIVISDHAGECPLCRPWENKILSITGKDSRYPSLETAKAAGLFHPNCRHTLTGYIEGLTDLEPNPQTAGVPEQSNYIAEQRSNERAIRRWKRREIVAIDDHDLMIAREKIREYQHRQRKLLEAYEEKFGMGLRRKYDRESIKNRVGITNKETSALWTNTILKDIKKTIKKAEKKAEIKPLPKKEDYKSWYGEVRKAGYNWKEGKSSIIPDVVTHSLYLENNPQFADAIRTYTGGSYSDINDVYRGKNSEALTKIHAERYANEIAQYKLIPEAPAITENIMLFRHNGINTTKHLLGAEAKKLAEEAIEFVKYERAGVNESLEKLKNLHVGGTIEDKAVLSTAYKEDVFLRSDGTELQIMVPKDFKGGVFAESVSNHSSEAEYIFKPGQKFQIVDVEIRKIRGTYTNISFVVFPIE